tara:strand:+ start:224 stop:709 length:486 start_codon:yes stop_codon:yes gene_type:complete
MHHLSKNLKLLALIPVFFFLTACPVEKRAALKTPAELLALQTRTFDGNKDPSLRAVVSVFQDLGYIIQTADSNTGLITAKSPTEASLSFFGRNMKDTKVTATIEQVSNTKTRVRLNFVQSKRFSSEYGMNQENEQPIYDPNVYQDAFAKIRNAIFLRKNIN